LRFSKYQGLGNDFVLVRASELAESTTKKASDLPELARNVCDRRFGIGADGLLIISIEPTGPARMVVYNSDGSRPEMCGNGLRCVAQFLVDTDHTTDSQFAVMTDAGSKTVHVNEGHVTVEMGAIESKGSQTIALDGHQFTGMCLDAGNPHFVLFGNWKDHEPEIYGSQLSVHSAFPEGANISFASLVGPNEIELRVWERGCGLTMACGTGACATAVASWIGGHAPEGLVKIRLPGGMLKIAGNPGQVSMTGPAEKTFEGAWR